MNLLGIKYNKIFMALFYLLRKKYTYKYEYLYVGWTDLNIPTQTDR